VNRSLLNELELSADFRTTSGLSAASSGIGGEEDEIECDEAVPTSSAHVKEVSALTLRIQKHNETFMIILHAFTFVYAIEWILSSHVEGLVRQ